MSENKEPKKTTKLEKPKPPSLSDIQETIEALSITITDDLPPSRYPPIKLVPSEFSSQVLVVGIPVSYAVGYDYTPISTAPPVSLLLSMS